MNRKNRKKEIQQIFLKSFYNYDKNFTEREQAYIIRIRDSFLDSQYFDKILTNHWKYRFNDSNSKNKLEEDIKNQFIHFLYKRKSRLKKIGKDDILAIPVVLFAYAVFSTYVLFGLSTFNKINCWMLLIPTTFTLNSIIQERRIIDISEKIGIINSLTSYSKN